MLYVFDQFPSLKFYFAETQGAWLAHALNWMDEFYLRWYRYHDVNLRKMPSQYYRDHCRFSFIHDRVVMQLRQFIDPALLMWGTDFPHSIGSLSRSAAILAEIFDGVPDERPAPGAGGQRVRVLRPGSQPRTDADAVVGDYFGSLPLSEGRVGEFGRSLQDAFPICLNCISK